MGLQPLATAIEGLLYRSRIVNRIGPLHMFLLVERARLANQAEGITGQLIYLDHSFMEYLEGPAAALDALWRNLRQDPRHYDVELLARFPLAQRRCANWPLACAALAYSGVPNAGAPVFMSTFDVNPPYITGAPGRTS